ncbi:hypothetical protein PC129_g19858 [Phytophthora cactorum]|uniref:Uncharacterized protein n=1 Tax=Phytophthora cactorum TaxID=29920 RepID=A0A8T1HBD3_9STRA|nr:hypothetical protein PC114_g21403 [Phytophthora cactorum]KAG2979914.1 hypothetical protein PC118_g11506 [Phytophthora cactorum]KAG3037770.1 hypothetical protein PC119_g3359 [Phytophthora cactorum]KAG3099635.1 hypothetical protein PC122_g3498 [Phytophthora cactorum]KAG3209122.1 hypothetical protein PC129_g19858 [Phytophthora cactorum]
MVLIDAVLVSHEMAGVVKRLLRIDETRGDGKDNEERFSLVSATNDLLNLKQLDARLRAVTKLASDRKYKKYKKLLKTWNAYKDRTDAEVSRIFSAVGAAEMLGLKLAGLFPSGVTEIWIGAHVTN